MSTVKSRFYLALFVSLSFHFPGFSQDVKAPGKISGKIVDENHQVMAFASVSLLRAADSGILKGSLSSEAGTYLFENVPNGNYLISISGGGHESARRGPFTISDSLQSYEVTEIVLAASRKQLQEVVVVSKKMLIERKIDRTVLNIENSALAARNSALDILARSPGVTVDQAGNISMRGKQGVSIMLDGKLTYMSGEQLASLLKATQGSSIQLIELITNPSAKYDASGSAGIINIRLKKNKNYGLNGTVNAGGGIGNYFKENGGINLNYRQKLFNIYGNFNADNSKRWRDLRIDRINRNGAGSTVFNQRTNVIIADKSATYKAGVDYFINESNTVGFMMNGSTRNGDDNLVGITRIGLISGKLDSSVRALNPGERRYRNQAYNLNYKSVLDSLGQELSVDLDYVKYNNNTSSLYNNQFYNQQNELSGKPIVFHIGSPAVINIWAAKLDYTYVFKSKTKLETGLKSSFVKTDNNLNYQNLYNGSWTNDTGKSNHFVYDENIQAAYANLSRDFNKTSVELGLRAEQTSSKGNSITTNKLVDRKYIDFFPSVFINQVLSPDNEMGFTYSRRVDRPNYADLNPFVSNFDLYTFAQGNPFLNPQYTNSIELSYSYKKVLNATLGIAHTSDVITEVTLPDTLKNTLYVTKQNLATQNSYYLNVSYPLKLTSWWTADNNVNLFYNKFNSSNLLGAAFSSGLTSVSVNIYQTFTVNSSTSVEASFLYISPSVQGTYHIGQFCYGDIGIKKSLLHNKASVKLALDDVFNSHKENIYSVVPGQHYRIYQKFETRVFRVSFSYRFGSNQIKDARKHRKSTSAEERRVN